jgi:TRAP-type C4-dicarboxylate transport system permease small subunit
LLFIKLLKKVNTFLENLLWNVATVFFAISLFVVGLDVFLRNVKFIPSILWGQEIALMTFIWSVFLGSAVVYRKKEHFKIEILPLNIQKSKFIQFFIIIIVLLFFYILLTTGIDLAMRIGLKRGSRPSGIPLFWVFISIPVTGFSMILFAIERFINAYCIHRNIDVVSKKNTY